MRRILTITLAVLSSASIVACDSAQEDERGCEVHQVVTSKQAAERDARRSGAAGKIAWVINAHDVKLDNGHTYRERGTQSSGPEAREHGIESSTLKTASKVGLCDVVSQTDHSHHYALRIHRVGLVNVELVK